MTPIPRITTRRLPFFVLGSLVLGSIAWAAGPERNGAKPIVVTDVAGSVDVTVAGASRDMRIDSLVPLPARIVTRADGVIAIRQVNTTVSIAPESDVEIPAAAVDGQLIARMIQHRGNAFYDVETREVGRLHVETPYLVAVVKGTQFNVAVQGSTSTISLFEGRLEIRSPDGGDIVQLEAGEIAIRTDGDTAIRVVRMDEDALPTPDNGTAAARPIDAAGQVAAALPVPAALGSERLDFGTRTTASAPLGVEVLSVGALAGELATLNIDKGMALGGAADLGLETGIDLGSGSVDIGLDAGVDLGGASVGVGLDTGVDLGGGSVDIGLDAGVDLGGASVGLGLDAGVDLGGGSVDIGLDTGVDLGGASVDLGLDAGVDLGGGSVDIGLDTGVDLGGASADLGLDTGVDLGGGSVDIGLDTGVDLGGASADLGLDTGVDLGGGTVDIGLDTGVDLGGAGVDVGLDAGVDLGTDPGLDVGLDLGGTGIDVGLDLGGSNPIDIDITPEEEGSGGGGLGGLLNRLL